MLHKKKEIMRKILSILILITSFSQIKANPNDSILLKNTINKLENIKTLSYSVISKYNIPYQTDTLTDKYEFRFKLSKIDTLTGFKIFKFWERDDFARKIYYNNYDLKKIEIIDSTITHYDLKKYPREIYSVKRIIESENNYFGILKVLKEAIKNQVKITYGSGKINGLLSNKISFVIKIGREQNEKKVVIWLNKTTFLPVKYHTVINSKISGVESEQFYERIFYSVKYNNNISDNKFTASGYKNFKKKEYIPENFPQLLSLDSIAPHWNLKNINGKNVKLEEFKGKTLFVEFWAPDCGFSLMSIETFKKIRNEYDKKNIEFVSIYFAKDPKYINPIIEKFNIDYSVLTGTEKIKKEYNAIAYPTTYIIGKDGKILFAQIGMLGFIEKKIIEVLDRLD